ncbi:alpha/beta hydrolase domain-containing protein [Lentinus tigrinus ALCF2SS1-7]|uniref:Alpha/beta hydrolase domain-containing protein n=1 Tax=Lentinus tigrinus ALCF2SS1-6 TaxID=1328759 RepID=A0A5C2S3U9_9APHY|nr:alpha/beta hydrolase domain-containing protein [Lentinus tigrinus ALCF2SS1-6]RPD73011.1 alpha/beta hydrolase domain-containing protein [Lentinus tigrinus ALCF2SS1-7]
MDVIAGFSDTAIHVVIDPTRDAFMKKLETRRSQIESWPSRTFRYGSTDRHQLDVYYPDAAKVSGNSVPVLFFEYGGGFISGDRKIDKPYDLAYANVGVFFAQRGVMTVIADYRLAPAAKFPDPPADIRDAIAWFIANTSTVSSGKLSETVDLSKIFVMGHSAGANHVMSLYLSPSVLPLDSPVRAATRGLIPKGGAFKFAFGGPPVLPPGLLEGYYGSEEAALANMPLTLLENAPEELIAGLPEVFVLASENEPEFIKAGVDEFVKKLEARRGRVVKYEIMKGHNHISPHWALLSGEGEDWADAVAEWVKSSV